eukprot:gene19008-2337_t
MKGRGRAKILLQWIAKVKAPTKIKRFAQRGVYSSRVGTSTHTAAWRWSSAGRRAAEIQHARAGRGTAMETRATWDHPRTGACRQQWAAAAEASTQLAKKPPPQLPSRWKVTAAKLPERVRAQGSADRNRRNKRRKDSRRD